MKIITKKLKNTAKNAIKSRKKAVKAVNFLHFLQFIDIFCNFLILIYFFVLPEIYRKTIKTINLRFFTLFFCNAPKFMAFFVPHRNKFTVAQGQFYDGKFFAVNSKKRRKSENRKKSLMLISSHLNL
jgi:hypothetical protein